MILFTKECLELQKVELKFALKNSSQLVLPDPNQYSITISRESYLHDAQRIVVSHREFTRYICMYGTQFPSIALITKCLFGTIEEALRRQFPVGLHIFLKKVKFMYSKMTYLTKYLCQHAARSLTI